jgi:hypothetical protein
MMEDPDIIQMNIDRYREMLESLLDDDTHARVKQLLGEARCQIAAAIDLQEAARGPGQTPRLKTLAR